MSEDARVARGASVRLAVIAVLWGSAAVRLGLLGWPWVLGAGGARSALGVGIGVLIGVAQGWIIATRTVARLLRWCREAATSRRMDLLLLGRGLAVIAGFAGLGLFLRWNYLETSPTFVGCVYVYASLSLVIATFALGRHSALEWRRA